MSQQNSSQHAALIELQQVCKQYTMGDSLVNALQTLDLEVRHGEYVAVLGPSGSGKSSLMNLLGCLDTPTAGCYKLEGVMVNDFSRNQLADIRNHKIGFIFQSFNLLPWASALDNVALPLVFRGTPAAIRTQKATALLTQVGLADRIHHRPQELSGGQQQRIAIARALVTEPELILADEPTGNLDSQSGNAIISLFETLTEQGKTVIIVTHDLTVAQRTRRILHIKDGRLVKDQKNTKI